MAAKIHFSSTRTREYRTPTCSRLRLRLRRKPRPTRSEAAGTVSTACGRALIVSLTPILLLHRSEGDGRRNEARDLEVDATFRADDDLPHLGVRLQGYGRGTLRAGDRRHDEPPPLSSVSS